MIPNALQHFHCPDCQKTVPADSTLADYERIEVAITATAIVVGCTRHKVIFAGFPIGVMVQAAPRNAIPINRTPGGVLTLPPGVEVQNPPAAR